MRFLLFLTLCARAPANSATLPANALTNRATNAGTVAAVDSGSAAPCYAGSRRRLRIQREISMGSRSMVDAMRPAAALARSW